MTVPDDSFGFGVNLDTGPPIVTVFGEIDILAVPSLSGALNGLIDDGQVPIVLDLGHVTFLDAHGAKAIAEAGARAHNAGQTIIVRSASAWTLRILELTDATGHVVIDTTASHRSVQRTVGDLGALDGSTAANLTATFPRSTIDLVDASLQLVTSLADATVPHTAGVSITLERYGQPMTVAASTDRVVAVDHHQYETGQGPCLDAKTYDQWFYVESLAEETRWPDFVPLAMEHGIGSILSSPLTAHDRSQGSLNLYATVERAFGPQEHQLAALFADKASHILTTADEDTTDQQWNERFATGLGARRAIHQAQGIIMARENVAADDALAHIMKTARARQMTVFAYAAEMVNSIPDDDRTENERTNP